MAAEIIDPDDVGRRVDDRSPRRAVIEARQDMAEVVIVRWDLRDGYVRIARRIMYSKAALANHHSLDQDTVNIDYKLCPLDCATVLLVA